MVLMVKHVLNVIVPNWYTVHNVCTITSKRFKGVFSEVKVKTSPTSPRIQQFCTVCLKFLDISTGVCHLVKILTNNYFIGFFQKKVLFCMFKETPSVKTVMHSLNRTITSNSVANTLNVGTKI